MPTMFNPFEFVVKGDSLKDADKIIAWFPALEGGVFDSDMLKLMNSRNDLEWCYVSMILPGGKVYDYALIAVQLKDLERRHNA